MGEAARSVFSASLSLFAGFAFIHFSYYRRFSAERLQTDRYAFILLGYSFAAFVLGQVAAELIPDYTPQSLFKLRADLAAAGITPPVINSILFGFAAAALDNIRVLIFMRDDVSMITRRHFFEDLRIAAVTLFVRKSNDSALRVIFRATIMKKSLMVTLKSHKVYVGKPYLLLWDDPTPQLTYIKLLPSKSGYRDPITKKVSLPTRYDELSNRLVEYNQVTPGERDVTNPLLKDILGLADNAGTIIADIDIEDLGVVIAWAEVESLTIFDENLYEAFQSQSS